MGRADGSKIFISFTLCIAKFFPIVSFPLENGHDRKPHHLPRVGKISRKKIKEIAELKMVDLNAFDIDGAMKIIEGTARSVGLTVVD